MDLQSALAGVPVVEVAPRVPVQTGPFGIKASPNGKLIAVTARESAKVDFEGNTISIIDVDRARSAPWAPSSPACASARTTRPASHGRSRLPGRRARSAIVVANYRTNNVSIVDVRRALAHLPGAEVARIPVTRLMDPDGIVRPGNPKGTAITSDRTLRCRLGRAAP